MMTPFEMSTVALAAAQVAVGIGQIAVVWYGIRAMVASGADRVREHDQRHAESMVALRELIARTATRPE
ncbi:MAG: hypothetical protein OXH52_18575 [Gammaproteobacteria bacterium]|nr:hypothetical protein [Gammaproteobacteria bacterium]